MKTKRFPDRTGVRLAVLVLPILSGLSLSAEPSGYTFHKRATIATPCTGVRGGIFFQYDFEPWSVNKYGDLAFAADFTNDPHQTCGVLLPSDGEGAFLSRDGQITNLALTGNPAPGGGTFSYGVLGYTAINDPGDIAVVLGLEPFTPADLEGFNKAGLYHFSHTTQRLTAVVVPGVTAAPGFGVFQSTGQHASLNSFGHIAFPGVVRTTKGTGADLGQGIFLAGENGHFSTIVAPGDPAPGGGVFNFAVNPWINDRGDIAFGAHVATDDCIPVSGFGPACSESIYVKSGTTGVVESIAHQGAPAPGGGHYQYAWGPVLNDQGDIVFMGELGNQAPPPPGAPRGIFLHSGRTTAAIARPGDSMPGGGRIATVNPTAIVGNYSLNNRGEVSFIASLEGGDSGLYVHSGTSLHVVVRTGTRIPGVGTVASVADDINGGSLNDRGHIFFWARLTDGSGVLLVAEPVDEDR